jgi:hypothetical protein
MLLDGREEVSLEAASETAEITRSAVLATESVFEMTDSRLGSAFSFFASPDSDFFSIVSRLWYLVQ